MPRTEQTPIIAWVRARLEQRKAAEVPESAPTVRREGSHVVILGTDEKPPTGQPEPAAAASGR
jgi:hypothetical protein